jgi:hypothetical protein
MGRVNDIRNFLTGRAQVDEGRDAAAVERMALAAKEGTDVSRFGVAMATSMSGRSDRDVRKLLPGIDTSEALPARGVARDERIFTASRDMARLHIEAGDNVGLGSETGRAAREATIVNLSRDRDLAAEAMRHGSLAALTEARTRQTGDDVRRYLSVSHQSDGLLGESARMAIDDPNERARLERTGKAFGMKPIEEAREPQQWAKLAMRMEQGYARSGAMPASELVAVATSAVHATPRRESMEGPAPSISMPNFVKGRNVTFGSPEMLEMSIKAAGPLTPTIPEKIEQKRAASAEMAERAKDRVARGPTMADATLRAMLSAGR